MGSLIPKIFHQTAPSTKLSWEEKYLLKRTQKLLPSWNYKLWTDDDISAVVQRNFAPHIDKLRLVKKGIVIADIGRYAILYEQGGIYLDTDYKLLKLPYEYLNTSCLLPIEEGELDIHERIKDPNHFKLGNAFLISEARYSFWKDFLTHIFLNVTVEELNNGNPVLTTGPIALTRFWRENRSNYQGILVPMQSEFYPPLKGLNLGISRTKNSQGVHLCWGSWRGKQSIQKYRNIARRKITCLL